MYGGVGLPTARGSGGSGYTQKNLSAKQFKHHNREQFLKMMDEQRKNNLPPPRKANQQIIQHERKRQLLIYNMKLREKLQKEGKSKEQIQQAIQKSEKILKDKMSKGQLQTKAKQTHILTQAKQKQMMKLSDAFGIKGSDDIGSAFKFEDIKQEKLRKLQEKRKKMQQFTCPYADCGKAYEMKQLLQRHLKHKHPEYKAIKSEVKRQKHYKQK